MNKILRNLIIFAIASICGGFLGMAIDRANPPQNSMQGLGALVWLITPLVTSLFLRAFGGDGWKDFGLGPNLPAGAIWYLAALLIIPFVTLLMVGLGAVFGAFSMAGSITTFIPLAGAAFAGVMVKNIFEEFAWRGYLTPRFEALKTPVWLNYLLTGLIWAGWHIPYYLYFLPRAVLASHTSLSTTGIILIALLSLPFQASAYGELRLLSKSVWPGWLMHNMANAISLTLLTIGFVALRAGPAGILLSPGSEGIIYSLLLGVIGYGLYKIRMKRLEEGKA